MNQIKKKKSNNFAPYCPNKIKSKEGRTKWMVSTAERRRHLSKVLSPTENVSVRVFVRVVVRRRPSVPLRCCLCAHAANASMCERDGPCLTLQHWHNCCTLIFRLYKQRVMSVIYSLVHASNYGASSLKSIGHPVLFCPVSGKRIFHLMVNLESVRGALCVGEIGTDMAAHS